MEKLVLCFFLLVCCLENASFGLQSLFLASFCAGSVWSVFGVLRARGLKFNPKTQNPKHLILPTLPYKQKSDKKVLGKWSMMNSNTFRNFFCNFNR